MKVLKTLEKECRENLFGEKILLASSHTAGWSMIKTLSEIMPVLNLKTATIQSLAEETAAPLMHQGGLTPIDNDISRHILFGILYEMQQNNRLEYFGDIDVTPSVGASLWNAVMELRYAAIGPEQLDENHFVSPSKGRDIKSIMTRYACELERQRLLDLPGMLELALRGQLRRDVTVLLPNNLKVRYLEKKFLTDVFPDIKVLCNERLEGLTPPASYFGSGQCPAEASGSPFNSLYAPENTDNSSTDNSISDQHNRLKAQHHYDHINIVRAYGETNEIRAVLRHLKAAGRPYDETCIYFTANEPYSGLLYRLSEQFGIPVTFGDGISIGLTKPGQAVLALLRWISNDYPVMDLCTLLSLGLVKLSNEDEENETVKPMHAARLLRRSGIGWGKGRYLPQLTEQLRLIDEQIRKLQGEQPKNQPEGHEEKKPGEQTKNQQEAEGPMEPAEQQQKDESSGKSGYDIYRRRGAAEATIRFIEALLQSIPEETSGVISIHQFCEGLADIVKKSVTVKNEFDAAAKEAVLKALSDLSCIPTLSMPMDEALRLLENEILGLRIGASGPKPGHLHLCSYRSGGYISRKRHWIMGLDAARFPGKTMEDPILLDAEKSKISEHLPLNRTVAKDNLYAMVQLLSCLEGDITLSYSSFDPAENRDQPPSPLLLQIFRMLTGDPSKDYSDLKKHLSHSEGFIPDHGLDANEFWLNRCKICGAGSPVREPVYCCYPHLKQGAIAWEQQSQNQFTQYDGYVGKTGIKTESIVFSASSLELLAKCAYRYFVKYILHVSPPEDILYDPELWLDPLTKGTLYHSIFEQFYKAIKGEKPDRTKHRELILKIAQELIQKVKEEIPPPSDVVFDMERREILESCLIFLASEEEHADEGLPEYFELAFGFSGDDASRPPVRMVLKSGRTMLLAGKIDRIDRLDEKTYRIVDYKSGGTYGYNDREFFKGGRQIQHALYACACETLFRESGRSIHVKEGIYLFPTRKGEGRRFIRIQKDRENLLSLLDDLLTIIDEGTFAATTDPNDCRWCEYQAMCRIHRLHTVISAKWEDQTVNGLSSLRRLKTYE